MHKLIIQTTGDASHHQAVSRTNFLKVYGGRERIIEENAQQHQETPPKAEEGQVSVTAGDIEVASLLLHGQTSQWEKPEVDLSIPRLREQNQRINGSNATEDDLRNVIVTNRENFKQGVTYIKKYYKQNIDEIVYADRTIGKIVEEAVISFDVFRAAVEAGDTSQAMEHLTFMRQEAAALLQYKGIKSYQTAIARLKFEKSANNGNYGINGNNVVEEDLRDASVINRQEAKNTITYIKSYYKQRLDEIVYADRTIGKIVEEGIASLNAFIAAVEAGDTSQAMEHLTFMRQEAAALLQYKGIKSYQTAIYYIRFEKSASDENYEINGVYVKKEDLMNYRVKNTYQFRKYIMHIKKYYKCNLHEIVYADRTIGKIVEESNITFDAFVAAVEAGDASQAMEYLTFMRQEAAALLQYKGIKSYQTAIARLKFERKSIL